MRFEVGSDHILQFKFWIKHMKTTKTFYRRFAVWHCWLISMPRSHAEFLCFSVFCAEQISFFCPLLLLYFDRFLVLFIIKMNIKRIAALWRSSCALQKQQKEEQQRRESEREREKKGSSNSEAQYITSKIAKYRTSRTKSIERRFMTFTKKKKKTNSLCFEDC